MEQYKMEVVEIQPRPTLTVTFSSNDADLPNDVAKALPAVFQYARSQKADFAGQPFVKFSHRNGPQFEAEAGIPVSSEIAGDGHVLAGHLPGGSTVTTIHIGPHELLDVAHRTLCAWARDNDFKFNGGPWEVYLTDTVLQTDSATWETQLFLSVYK